jgi:hypothetical protein
MPGSCIRSVVCRQQLSCVVRQCVLICVTGCMSVWRQHGLLFFLHSTAVLQSCKVCRPGHERVGTAWALEHDVYRTAVGSLAEARDIWRRFGLPPVPRQCIELDTAAQGFKHSLHTSAEQQCQQQAGALCREAGACAASACLLVSAGSSCAVL